MMRRFFCASAICALAILSFAAERARAEVIVHINRSTQTMEVVVDGVPRYRWPISSGRRRLPTPAGIYHPHLLERYWFSRKYHNSPMPHSIFFRGGIAIHGTYETAWLGRPVSHGCVRLYPTDAAVLFRLVQQEGMRATTIVVH